MADDTINIPDVNLQPEDVIPGGGIEIPDVNVNVDNILTQPKRGKTSSFLLGAAEGFTDELQSLIDPESVGRGQDTDLTGGDTSTSSEVGQVVGQAMGSTGIIAGSTAVGASIGALFGVVGAVPGAAIGAGVGATAKFVQGARRQFFGVEEQADQASLKLRGVRATEEEKKEAKLRAATGILGERAIDTILSMTGVGKIGQGFVNTGKVVVGTGKGLVSSGLKGVSKTAIKRQLALEATTKTGRIVQNVVNRSVGSGLVEGATEAIQGASERAAVSSTIEEDKNFIGEFGSELVSKDAAKDFALGAIGGVVAGNVAPEINSRLDQAIRTRSEQTQQAVVNELEGVEDSILNPYDTNELMDGLDALEAVENGEATTEQQNAVEIVKAIYDIKDDSNDRTHITISPDKIAFENLSEALKPFQDLRVNKLKDGSTRISVNPDVESNGNLFLARANQKIKTLNKKLDSIKKKQGKETTALASKQKDLSTTLLEQEGFDETTDLKVVDKTNKKVEKLQGSIKDLETKIGSEEVLSRNAELEAEARRTAESIRIIQEYVGQDPDAQTLLTYRYSEDGKTEIPDKVDPRSELPFNFDGPPVDAKPDLLPSGKTPKDIVSVGDGNKFRERGVATSLKSDPTINPFIQELIGDSEYQQITNKDTVEQITKLIDQNGILPSAEQFIRGDLSNLTPAQVTTFGGKLINDLNLQATRAEIAGNDQAFNELSTLALKVERVQEGRGTELGQGVQAFGTFLKSSPVKIIQRIEQRIGKKLSPESRLEIFELQQKVIDSPEGVLRNKASQDVLVKMSTLEGVSKSDLATAAWYAHMLSGTGTQAINIFGNAANLFSTAASLSATNPKFGIEFFKGAVSAMKPAMQVAHAALKGEDITRTYRKINAPGALETVARNPEASTAARWSALAGSMVFRSLGAMDGAFYTLAHEGMARVAARRSLDGNPNLNNVELAKAVNEKLGFSEEARSKAIDDATFEVETFSPDVTGKAKDLLVKRRVFEILQNSRDEDITKEARRLGELVTFTNEPEGVIGQLTTALESFFHQEIPGTKIAPGRLVLPFTRTVANILNTSLEYTPIGFGKIIADDILAANKLKEFGLNPKNKAEMANMSVQDFRKYSHLERQRRVGSAILGTMSAALISSIAAAHLEEDDPEFAIYGAGPGTQSKRAQLQSRGWKPWSVKLGDKYYRYNELPIGIMLASIGAYHDADRFKDTFKDKELSERLEYGLTMSLGAIGDLSFLQGVTDFFDVISGRKQGKSMSNYIANIGNTMIPGSQGLFRELEQTYDPTIEDNNTFKKTLLKTSPLTAWLSDAKPILDAFGEPVEYNIFDRLPLKPIGRLVSEEQKKTDTAWQFLADNGLWIRGLGNTVNTNVNRYSDPEELEIIKTMRLYGAEFDDIGRVAADQFTPNERWEFARETGGLTKLAVYELMSRRDEFPTKELMQKQLDKRVDKIRRSVKAKMLGLSELPDPGFFE